MIKTAAFAVAFALGTAGSAMPQGAPWCLQRESAQSCTYSTLQQCLANRTGAGSFCNQNSTYTPVPPRQLSRRS
jgi:hypothetical protein